RRQRSATPLPYPTLFRSGPETGEMAERGEAGPGRLADVPRLMEAIGGLLGAPARTGRHATDAPLAGRHVLVTSGPTHEPIDPVRDRKSTRLNSSHVKSSY